MARFEIILDENGLNKYIYRHSNTIKDCIEELEQLDYPLHNILSIKVV